MTKNKHIFFTLPRSVYILTLARVVNAMGNFVFPFLTLLLTTKIGMSEQKAGLFLLIAAALQVPGSLLGGKLADRTGRKLIMILNMGLAALCYIPSAFLINSEAGLQILPWLLMLSSFLFSVSLPASSAMLNDLTQPQNRQGAFSLLYMGMNVGTAIGSIVAGLLFGNHMKLLFLGDAATTFLSLLLLILFVPETKPTRQEIEQIKEERIHEKAEEGNLLSALLHKPALLIFALIDSIYAFVYAQTIFGIPLQANAIFGDELGPKLYGTFNMVNCLEVIFLTTVVMFLTKKIKAIHNVAISGIFFGIGYGLLYFTNGITLFLISTVIWTLGEIIHATNQGVYIANHTPVSHRGRFSSIIEIISESGRATSPYIMGGFIALYGLRNLWPVIFLLCIFASISMFLLGKAEQRKTASVRE